MAINKIRLQQLQSMVIDGTLGDFYDWTDWVRTRSQVLNLDQQECQICRQHGRYRKAVVVHHVQHLRDRPDLALSVFDPDTHERQLISLCRACHEDQHPERGLKKYLPTAIPLTEERWD